MPLALPTRAAWSLLTTLLAEIVSPSGCAACDAPVGPQTLFCPPCASSAERASAAGSAHATFAYGGAPATAIARLKYGDRPDLGARLGKAMLAEAARLRGAVDLVVPVPLHPKRLSERGYNQAALLAAPVARSMIVDLEPSALARVRDTPKQASLDRPARLTSVRGAFVARGVGGARVLLVDDVATTGATLAAASEALGAGGAGAVVRLVLAQAL